MGNTFAFLFISRRKVHWPGHNLHITRRCYIIDATFDSDRNTVPQSVKRFLAYNMRYMNQINAAVGNLTLK